VLNVLTAADAGKYVRLFVLPLGRQQAQDRLANDLLGRIAEEVPRFQVAMVPSRSRLRIASSDDSTSATKR
jgi:hypothetical protein